ncbi:hypothetical protein [Armatimonas rosea]|uniref:DUF4352 domain-containing protein n=1 Tax=Armatimonas rosea TaxID=685828 RepID=A0A7W9SMY6_ARMRO|nr:hypothetical protein [Armatimonas rosea]MBB6049582.1 hypothetical protein [Armatimonas rosea]
MKALSLAATLLLIAPALAQKPKPKAPPAKPPQAKPAPKNETKGQGQLQGVNGQFGVVYSLQNELNVSILSAKYTLEPFRCYSATAPKTEEKLVVLNVALKNVSPKDNWFNSDGFFTLVDAQGNLYPNASWALQSNPDAEFAPTLRPGQGLGQATLNDAVQAAFVVPAKARIVKVMINQGRLGRADEKVFRFFVAGATKEEAGEAGDPKNTVAALPASAADSSDASGATPLAEGKGTPGQYVPSGNFLLRLDKLALSSAELNGNPPEEGKQFAVATVTAKFANKGTGSVFDITGGDFPLHALTDTDGESYKPTAYYKASRDEDASKEFKFGDEYTFRIVFQVPKSAKLKKLTLGCGGAHKWAYEGIF